MIDIDGGFSPHATIQIGNRWLTPEERHELWWDQEARNHILACARHPVRNLLAIIPAKYLFALMENKEPIGVCCRQAVDHDIEAFWTSAENVEPERPDLYVLHCKCGRKHRRMMVGGAQGSGAIDTNQRPFWEVK